MNFPVVGEGVCVGSHGTGHMLPLWDVYSHPQHLLLEVLLVVAQSTFEEEEAGAVGLTLTHTHTLTSTLDRG